MVFLLLCFNFSGQAFQRYIGGIEDDNAHSIVPSQDGGYFVTAETSSFGFGQQDFMLLKFDATHSLVWSKVYGTNSHEFGTSFSVLELTDGNLILTGRVEDGPGQPDYALIWKVDPLGDIIWSKELVGVGSFYADVFGKCIELDNGELVCLGSSQSVTTGNQDAFIAKITQDGDLINSIALGGNSPDHALRIILDGDELLVMHNGSSFGPGISAAGLMRLDLDLNVIWYKRYGSDNREGFFDNTILPDGDILNVGFTRSFGSDHKGMMVRTNTDGELIFARTFNIGNGDDRFVDVCPLSDGRYLLTLSSESINEIIHVLIDENLNLQYSLTLGETTSSLIEKHHNSCTIELNPLEVTTVGAVFGSGISGNDIYQVLYNVDDLPCSYDSLSIEVEDINITEINPNYNTTTGGSLGDHDLQILDVTNLLTLTEECSTISPICELTGSFDISGICQGEEVEFSFDLLNYTASDVSWNWTLSDGQSSTSANPEFEFNDPGEVEVTLSLVHLTIPDCTEEFDTTITVSPIPDFTIVFPDSACVGDLVTLAIPEIADQIIWSNSMDGQNITFELEASQSVEALFTLNGCTSSSSVFITAVDPPNPSVLAPEEVCEGEVFTLEVLPGDFSIEWAWASNEWIVDTLISSNSNFDLNAFNDFCSTNSSVTIEVLQGPEVFLDGPEIVCEGLEVNIEASGADDYFWSTGETGNHIDFLFLGDTSISVVGSNQCGEDMAEIFVDVQENDLEELADLQFFGQFGTDIVFNLPGEFDYLIFSDSGVLCDDCDGFLYTISGDQVFTLFYENDFGCAVSAQLFVNATPCTPLWVPNSITPNADGLNDNFKAIIDPSCVDLFEMEIYNRWGQLVFKSEDPELFWNGTGDLSPDYYAQTEVYSWIIKYKYEYEAEIRTERGSISLIR